MASAPTVAISPCITVSFWPKKSVFSDNSVTPVDFVFAAFLRVVTGLALGADLSSLETGLAAALFNRFTSFDFLLSFFLVA